MMEAESLRWVVSWQSWHWLLVRPFAGVDRQFRPLNLVNILMLRLERNQVDC